MNSNSTPFELPEMIDLFLDGELSAPDTDTLFHSLAGNSELQHSFQQSVHLLRSAVADARSVSVPPPNVSGIFGKAGFAITSATPLAVATAPSFFAKFAPLAMAAGVSSILTFVITFMLMSNSRSIEQSATPVLASKGVNSLQEHTQKSHSTVPPQSSPTANGQHSRNNFTMAHSTQIEPPVQTDVSGTADEYNDATETAVQSTTSITTVTLASTPYEKYTSHNDLHEIIPPTLPDSKEDMGVVIQLRGIGGIGVVNEAPLFPSSTSGSANFGITGYFRLNEREMIGIELGQEELSNSGLSTVRNDRFGAVTFAALAYRFSMKPYSETGILKPYGQIALGGTQLGALGRISVGVEWQPFPMFGIIAGTEFSAMSYRYNNRFQLSKKVGVYTGISVGF